MVFLFEVIISKNYPFDFGQFYFKTKMFHPNIDSNNGIVSLDIFEDEWCPALSFRTAILSVQSLLNSPNPDIYLNQNAAKLYKENINKYEETVKDYVKKYSNIFIFEDELSKYKFKIEHIEM